MIRAKFLLFLFAALLSLAPDASSQQPLFELLSPQPTGFTSFGWSVALDGDHVAVSDPYATATFAGQNYPDAGVVHVYSSQTGALVTSVQHPALDPTIWRFGLHVDMADGLLAVHWRTNTSSTLDRDGVCVFDVPSGQLRWTWQASVSSAVISDIDLDSGHLLVSAVGNSFLFDASSGAYIRALTGNGTSGSCALSGSRALVGSVYAGVSQLVDANTNALLHSLTPRAGDVVFGFGYAVAMSSDYAVVAASVGGFQGDMRAYVYDLSSGAHVQTINMPGPIWYLVADCISASGDRLAMGTTQGIGLFDLESGIRVGTLADSPAVLLDIPDRVSLEGDRAAIGAWSNGGAAYMYDAPHLAHSFCDGASSTTPCPCGNISPPGTGCTNSSGAGAQLRLDSNAVATPGLLDFSARDLPAQVPVLLFVGTTALAGGNGLLFGDGLLCVGGSMVRLGTRTSSGAGSARWLGVSSAVGGWGPGQTRPFQVYFRDLAGPCSTGFNTSNGLEIEFLP